MLERFKDLDNQADQFISSIGKRKKKAEISLEIDSFAKYLENVIYQAPKNSSDSEKISKILELLRGASIRAPKISDLRTTAALAAAQVKDLALENKAPSAERAADILSHSKLDLKSIAKIDESDIKLLALGFSICSAFMIGAVTTLGIGFLPIIDKIDAIVLLSFYVGAFYIFSKIALGLYKPLLFSIENFVSNSSKKNFLSIFIYIHPLL